MQYSLLSLTLRPRLLSKEFWERAVFPWPTPSELRMHLERCRHYRVEYELPNSLVEAG